MHSLLAPILAQLVTVGLGDHAEGRYVVDENERYFESSNETVVGADVTLTWRRATLRFGYTPSLLIVPLEESPREVALYHTAYLEAQYHWRHTTLSLSQSVGYGQRDYGREALAPRGAAPAQEQPPTQPPPTTEPGQPTTPGTGGPGGQQPGTTNPETSAAASRAVQRAVRVVNATTRASLLHSFSQTTTFLSYVGYSYNGGVDDESRADYPIVRGPNAGAEVGYRSDVRNRFDTNLDAQLGWSVATTGFALTLTETWIHDFDRQTEGNIGGGLAYTRNAPVGEATAHTISPTGHTGITHAARVGRGMLTMHLNANSAPVLDMTTATVDPRLAADFGIGWTYERFSINAAMGAAISLTANSAAGTFNSIGASLTAAYDIGAGFSTEVGTRAAWQTFEGATIISPTSVVFAGVRWGAVVPLTRGPE